MNSFRSKTYPGDYECGICGEPYAVRIDAEKCCSQMVERSDLKHGRQPLKAYLVDHEQRWAKPHPRPYQELRVAQRAVSY